MTGVCYDENLFSEEEKDKIRQIFCSFGKMKIVEERLIDAVGCVSGCSPAYVYMFIEALADGAVKYGLSRKDAYEMAAQTVLGSAKMEMCIRDRSVMHPYPQRTIWMRKRSLHQLSVDLQPECFLNGALLLTLWECLPACQWFAR